MLWSAIVLGVLGSLHCVGMCGPIAIMLPVNQASATQKYLQISMYHLGRLIAYTILGLVFGAIGSGFYFFGIQQQLAIAIGVLLIVSVVIPTAVFNTYKLSKSIYKGIAVVKKNLGKALKKKTADAFLTMGFLNGFLPCGLVYIAVFSAITQASVAQSGWYMFCFGLGTIPLLSLPMFFKNYIPKKTIAKLQQLIPFFVVILGILFILRGLGLGIPYVSPAPVINSVHSTIECH